MNTIGNIVPIYLQEKSGEKWVPYPYIIWNKDFDWGSKVLFEWVSSVMPRLYTKDFPKNGFIFQDGRQVVVFQCICRLKDRRPSFSFWSDRCMCPSCRKWWNRLAQNGKSVSGKWKIVWRRKKHVLRQGFSNRPVGVERFCLKHRLFIFQFLNG